MHYINFNPIMNKMLLKTVKENLKKSIEEKILKKM